MPPKEIPDELIDQLLAGREGPEAIPGPDGLLKQLTKRVVERAASADLSRDLLLALVLAGTAVGLRLRRKARVRPGSG